MMSIGSPVLISLQLAAITTFILFVLGLPLAWWLANTRSPIKPAIEAVTALPLVLPPTVIGFYLLILMNPGTPVGQFWVTLTGEALTFSFSGLVVASVIYSLPFMVQPLQAAFERVGTPLLEAGASLRAGPWDRFRHIVLPLSSRGFIAAGVLTFAHTIGEFGVVLMVGGNIPGRTRVVSIALYDHVETLDYASAHILAAGLVVFSFLVLALVFLLNRRFPVHAG